MPIILKMKNFIINLLLHRFYQKRIRQWVDKRLEVHVLNKSGSPEKYG